MMAPGWKNIELPPGTVSSAARKLSRVAPGRSRTDETVPTTPIGSSSRVGGKTITGVGSSSSETDVRIPTSVASNVGPAGGSTNAVWSSAWPCV